MAITYHGGVSVPTDNGANAGAGPTAVTPPASMTLNDLVLVHQQYRGTGLEGSFGNTEAGGQSWHELKQHAGTSISAALWACRFNGTWSADPTFTSDSTLAHSMVMDVWRPSSTAKIMDIDVAPVVGSFTAGSTPFTKTINGITTLHDGAAVMAYWLTADDNTWDSLSGGWTNPGGVTQVRNTTGSDQSMARAYKIMGAAGATGNVAMNQATLGGDAGRTLICSFYERDDPTGTPTADVLTDFDNSTDGTTITQTIIDAATHPASPGGTWSEDLGGGASNMTIETDAEKLFNDSRKVTVNGVTYDDVGSTRGFKQAHDSQAGLAKFWRFTLTSDDALVSIGHYYRTNIDYGSFSSMTVNQVVDGGFAGLVALNWQDTEATFHTAYIENSLSETQPFAHILKDTWYWVTIQYDDVANLGKVALYDPATWTQVGFTGTMRLGTTPGPVNQILLGQNGGGLASRAAGTLSYFDDFMIDFTTGQFPLLPGAAAGSAVVLSGTIALVSTCTGTVQVAKPLAGSVPLATTLTGAVGVQQPLASALTLVSTLTATLGQTRALAGSIGPYIATAPILDAFTRADEDPVNGNWAPLSLGNPECRIVANVLRATPSSVPSYSYWSASTVGPTSEIYAEVVKRPFQADALELYLRVVDPGLSSRTGYRAVFEQSALADTLTVRLDRITNDLPTTLATATNVTTWADGDSIGFSLQGSLLQAFHQAGAGPWQLVAEVADATYREAGYLGVGIVETLANATALDNVGGGTVADEGTRITGTLSTLRAVAGPVALVSTLTGALSVQATGIALTGTLDLVSTVSGALTGTKPLTGTVGLVTTLTGTLTTQGTVVLDGTLALTTTLAGALQTTLAGTGALDLVSTITGSLKGAKPLSGACPILLALTGDLSLQGQVVLAGSITTASTINASLNGTKTMTGVIGAGMSITGSLPIERPLVANVAALSALTGSLGLTKGCQGAILCTTTITGALRLAWALAGTSADTLTFTGLLEIAGLVGEPVKVFVVTEHGQLFDATDRLLTFAATARTLTFDATD